jgi:hypothetical protein
MKKIIIVSIIVTIIVCVLIAGCATTTPKAPLQITYYYSQNCGSCAMLDADFAKLEQNHRGEFVLTKYDVNKEADRFRNDISIYNLDANTVPLIIINNQTFSGFNESIYNELERKVINR